MENPRRATVSRHRRRFHGFVAVAALLELHALCRSSRDVSLSFLPTGPAGGRRAVGLAGIVGCGGSALLGSPALCGAEEVTPAVRGRVVDEFNVLTPDTRSNLEVFLGKVEKDTSVKVRVLCPPPGIMGKKEGFVTFFRPIKKDWNLDQKSVVIVAEERPSDAKQQAADAAAPMLINDLATKMKPKKQTGGFQYPATVAGNNLRAEDKRPSILTIMAGTNFLDRFNGGVALDYLYSVETTYGNSAYVADKGRDGAVTDAVRNIAAILYNIEDLKKAKGTGAKPLKEAMGVDEATAMIAKGPA